MTAINSKRSIKKDILSTPSVDGQEHPKSPGPNLFRSPRRIQEIVTLLKLVTAPSRQMIILLLANGEKNVGEICSELGSSSQPAISHQLSLLRHGKLIEAMRNGRNVYYQLTPSGEAIAKAFLLLAKTSR